MDLSDAQYSLYNDSLSKFLVRKGDILIAMTGATVGKVAVSQHDDLLLNQRVGLVRTNENKLSKHFLKSILLSDDFYSFCQTQAGGGAQGNISPKQIKEYKIPLPPLEIQQQIVAELDGYQKIISGARQVIENWKPKIDIDPGWEKVKLGDVLSFIGSGSTPLGGQEVYLPDGVLFIRSQNVLWGICDFSDAVFIREDTYEQMNRSKVEKNDVLFNITGASIGRCAIYLEDRKANVNQHVTILRGDNKILPLFLMNTILDKSIQDQIWAVQGGASRQALNYQQIRLLEISLPPLEIQKQIVAQIESERTLVESNKKLIEIFERKIKSKIAEVWGE